MSQEQTVTHVSDMDTPQWESQIGLLCQAKTTRWPPGDGLQLAKMSWGPRRLGQITFCRLVVVRRQAVTRPQVRG